MGTPTPQRAGLGISIADALFTRTQQRVLAELFGNTSRSYYASEIIARAQIGSGAVQRELARLEASGLISSERIGNQKHYRANERSPVFASLRELVVRTSGLADVLRAARSNHLERTSRAQCSRPWPWPSPAAPLTRAASPTSSPRPL